MKLAVEFPSVAYREGPAAVTRLAKAIEDIGFDQLDMFDHVVMGHATETRGRPMYPPEMPILEALMVLSYAAAVTSRIGLGTEVLVLPQRQPVLVAKQISTLDTLSGGRVRLGVGVGWQASEYDALEEAFSNRGARMDEAIDLIRAYWRDDRVDYQGTHYTTEAMAMEPKSPQGAALPIWIGGTSERALRRVGEKGDGWLATAMVDADHARQAVQTRIAEPLGLSNTVFAGRGVVTPPALAAPFVQNYADSGVAGTPYESVSSSAFAAGALISTPTELREFLKALSAGALVSAGSLEEMTEPQSTYYGLGMELIDLVDDPVC